MYMTNPIKMRIDKNNPMKYVSKAMFMMALVDCSIPDEDSAVELAKANHRQMPIVVIGGEVNVG